MNQPTFSSWNQIALTLVKLALDVYYFILKQFKEQGRFPPCISLSTKQAIEQQSEMVELRGGKLYSCSGKSAGRLVVTQEKARFSLLRKAHVRGEMHYDRNGGLKHLLEMNVFWKGMSLDLDAFIHACPDCVDNNPLHNKAVVRIPTKSKVLPADRDDSDPHMSEDEEEECSYEDLIQYLTDGTFPGTLSEAEQMRIKLRTNFFSIINGSLHYQPLSRPRAPPRQVLFAESCRHAAIQEAHIGSFCNPPIPHRNPLIQKRVEKFRSYYLEGCGREFFRGTSFRYHLKSHTRGKLTPLPCDQCNRTFATQNRLDRHKEYKHPAVPRVFMCNQCGKVFNTARSLKSHEQSHSGVRKYQCQYCSKSFIRKEVLDNHLKIHTTDWSLQAAKHHDQNHQPNMAGELTVSVNQPDGQVMTISASHPSGEVVTSVIQWTEEEQRQAADRISQQNLIVTDLDVVRVIDYLLNWSCFAIAGP
nr:hypothetical protein BaRGS_000261 [Batillaria attramentaria]